MERTRGWRDRALGLGLAAVVGLAVSACDDDDGPTEPEPTVVELAATDADLETLAAAVAAAELAGPLSGSGPFTVFAPTDAAFGDLPAGTLEALLEPANRAVLVELLQGHVVAGAVRASELSDGQMLTTLSGDELQVRIAGSSVTIDGRAVLQADLEASNGVVHVIGGVLTDGLDVVERASVTPDLSTLVTAVTEAGLAQTLASQGPFTVFAPVDAAFESVDEAALSRLLADGDLLTKVLTYHVVPGRVLSSDLVDGAEVATVEGSPVRIGLDGGPTVNGANIVATDIAVENGVIHLIDGVLLDHLDLVDVAELNGFTALISAVESAGLTAALRDPAGALTVFAPTDEAFAAVGALPTGDLLQSVLLYHVVPGEAFSTDLADGQTLTTLQGSTATVRISATGVTLEGATNAAGVVATDVPASNGVIHVLDTVLLPAGD